MCTHRVRRFPAALLLTLAALACGDGHTPTSVSGGSGVLRVEPDRVSLTTARQISLNAQQWDASGNPVVAPSIAWRSEDDAIAAVSSSGEVTASSVGTTRVIATSDGLSASADVTVLPLAVPGPTEAPQSGHYVSPSGSSDSDGGASAPWDLATALSGANGQIHPGDTVWLRKGVYPGHFVSSLTGSAAAPIIVRAYPGERATVDGNISVEGRYTWYWGFEVANTDPATQNIIGVDSHCPGCRFINLVIHDHSGDGLGMWSEGPDQEAYGNIIYNNGFHGSTSTSYGHGIYAQNVSGAKRLIDNILINQFGYGIHIYTEESGLWNFIVTGNAAVNSGQGDGMDYQVGGLRPVENLVFTNNMSYRSPELRGNTVRLGYTTGPENSGATVTGNYLVGKLLVLAWNVLTLSDNTILDGSLPNSTKVFVEPSLYEPNRANILVYNWGDQSAVSVDLSRVLSPGVHYEVRAAENFYGLPVASGRYSGGSVSIPIVDRGVATSVTGRSLSRTGTRFTAYVIVGR